MIIGMDTHLTETLVLDKPCTTLELQADILSSPDVAIKVTAPHCRIIGPGSIQQAGKSAIMLADGADDFTIDGVTISEYNTSDTNGHGAIFANGTNGIDRITVRNCKIFDGNGNFVRLHACRDVLVELNRFSDSHGQSAEGITLNPWCEMVGVVKNQIISAWTTGILLWGGPHQTVLIDSNTIKNCGQAKDGTHPAIGINPQGQTVSGLIVRGNWIYDDQATPTQNCGIITYDTGTARCGRVKDNLMWGCPYKSFYVPANGSAVVLQDWVCQ